MSDATSGAGRCQLSDEKANNVNVVMPRSGADSSTRRSARAPASWPADRGNLRPVAQRPLPSMMIATCSPAGCSDKVLCSIKLYSKKKTVPNLLVAHRLDQRFHMVQVALKRAATGLGQTIFGLRNPSIEGFRAGDVLRFLQLAGMHAEVAVRRLEERLEIAEAERLVDGERADDPQAHPLVNQAIQVDGPGPFTYFRAARDDPCLHGQLLLILAQKGAPSSHRTST